MFIRTAQTSRHATFYKIRHIYSANNPYIVKLFTYSLYFEPYSSITILEFIKRSFKK